MSRLGCNQPVDMGQINTFTLVFVSPEYLSRLSKNKADVESNEFQPNLLESKPTLPSNIAMRKLLLFLLEPYGELSYYMIGDEQCPFNTILAFIEMLIPGWVS